MDFGNFKISRNYVIFEREATFAFITRNQILPGHFVLCPKANIARFSDLNQLQLFEISLASQMLARVVQS